MPRKLWSLVGAFSALVVLATGAFAQEEQEQPAQGVQVSEILLGSELENGVPTEQKTSFSHADRAIYCVVRLTNGTGEEGAIRVAFEAAEGEPQARPGGFRLAYPARPRYRTVARTTTNRPAGNYRCVVRTEEGAVLSHADFSVTE